MALSPSLLDEALSLSLEQRVELTDRLLQSLHVPAEPAIEKAWAEEVERRLDAVLSGEAETYPHEEVVAEVRAALRK